MNNVNRDNLLKIISDNSDTEFGKKFDFSSINSIKEYMNRVPISDYTDYQNAVDEMFKGKKNVLTAYEIYDYAVTSGSAGKRKVFPVTYEALKRYGTHIDERLINLAKDKSSVRLLVSRILSYEDVEKKSPKLLSELYYGYQLENNLWPVEQFVGGKELNFLSRTDSDHLYIKLWLALSSPKIVTLEGIFLYDLLIFFNYMKGNWRIVISDMETGRISSSVKISERSKETLIKMIPSRERLDSLRREFERGYENIAKRIFPDIKLISGIGSLPAMTEEILLKRYTGDIPVSHFCYVSSECHIGVPDKDDSYDYRLLGGSAFFEFRPQDENEEKTLLPMDLTVGKNYELIITTFCGLYRYATGDIVTVTGFEDDSPLIRFKCRRDLMLNVGGEKVDELTLDSVMRDFKEKTNINLSGYLAKTDITQLPGRYEIIVCTDTVTKSNELPLLFDRLMIKYSRDYEDLRNMGSIGMPVIRLCNEEEYRRSRRHLGMDLGHLKPVHIAL